MNLHDYEHRVDVVYYKQIPMERNAHHVLLDNLLVVHRFHL